MKVMIIYAHPNPLSFTRGLREAGHHYEVIDLYRIKFNPVFQDMDPAFFVDEDMPKDLFRQMDMRKKVS